MMSRLLPIGCLLLALGLFFGYMQPTWSGSIASKKSQITSYESALAAADRYKSKEAELTRARNSIPPESIEKLNRFLPDSIDNVQIILDLDALAARSNVKLSNFDVKSTTAAPDAAGDTPSTGGLQAGGSIDSAEITLTVTGTYTAFRGFLTQMEQSLRMLDVITISVKDSKTGVYGYDLTVRIYSLH